MISEVLSEITAAEQKAAEIAENAEKQAKEISMSVMAETENLKKEYEARSEERRVGKECHRVW